MAFVITQQMLDEAQAAYHSLMLGESVVEFRDQNGELVRRSRADASKLLNYINYLKKELGIASACTGPMKVWM